MKVVQPDSVTSALCVREPDGNSPNLDLDPSFPVPTVGAEIVNFKIQGPRSTQSHLGIVNHQLGYQPSIALANVLNAR